MSETEEISPRTRAPSRAVAAPGTTLAGRFEVVRLLGQGGMGQVYEAYDRLLGQKVAVKAMLPDRTDERTASRFVREIQLARMISHPNVCRLHDVVIDRNSHEVFLSMELLQGGTLADVIRRGPLPPDEVLPILRQLAAGLEASHQAGIVHRDLKPSNVLLDETSAGLRVVLSDFGIARAVELPQPSSAARACGRSRTPPACIVCAPSRASAKPR